MENKTIPNAEEFVRLFNEWLEFYCPDSHPVDRGWFIELEQRIKSRDEANIQKGREEEYKKQAAQSIVDRQYICGREKKVNELTEQNKKYNDKIEKAKSYLKRAEQVVEKFGGYTDPWKLCALIQYADIILNDKDPS